MAFHIDITQLLDSSGKPLIAESFEASFISFLFIYAGCCLTTQGSISIFFVRSANRRGRKPAWILMVGAVLSNTANIVIMLVRCQAIKLNWSLDPDLGSESLSAAISQVFTIITASYSTLVCLVLTTTSMIRIPKILSGSQGK